MTKKLKFKIVCGENATLYFATLEQALGALPVWQERFPRKKLIVEDIVPKK